MFALQIFLFDIFPLNSSVYPFSLNFLINLREFLYNTANNVINNNLHIYKDPIIKHPMCFN